MGPKIRTEGLYGCYHFKQSVLMIAQMTDSEQQVKGQILQEECLGHGITDQNINSNICNRKGNTNLKHCFAVIQILTAISHSSMGGCRGSQHRAENHHANTQTNRQEGNAHLLGERSSHRKQYQTNTCVVCKRSQQQRP